MRWLCLVRSIEWNGLQERWCWKSGMGWNGGKDVGFQYKSFGESVAIREVAVPLFPFAELEADILGMCVEKESRTVN